MQEIKLLFDNNLTLLYSVMMSLWAVIYLELWKRYSALLTRRWGVMFYSPEEEQPRPEYLAGKNIEAICSKWFNSYILHSLFKKLFFMMPNRNISG